MGNGVAVVVVSYNTREMTLRSVRAILESDEPVEEVWVIDNGSHDGTVEALRRFGSSLPTTRLQVLDPGTNLGFGAANNLGIRQTQADYVAFINSDAFVERDTLQRLREHLELYPTVGVVGPRLLHVDGSAQESRFAFPSPLRAWMENVGVDGLIRKSFGRWFRGGDHPDWLSGACLMMRRDLFERLGGFDEGFFLYSEETDLQYRIRAVGWDIQRVSHCTAVHVGGASGGGEISQRVAECFFDGVDRYFLKHHGRWGFYHLRAATALGAVRRAIAWFLLSRLSQAGRPGIRWDWLLRRQLTTPAPVLSVSHPALSSLGGSSKGRDESRLLTG